jgi:hypothetical protein
VLEVPTFLRAEERTAQAQKLVRKVLQDAARLGLSVDDIARAFNAEAGVEIRE